MLQEVEGLGMRQVFVHAITIIIINIYKREVCIHTYIQDMVILGSSLQPKELYDNSGAS